MKRNVLVVHDSAAGRKNISCILSQDGMEVDFAESCEDAGRKIDHKHYDLLIIDETVHGFSEEWIKDAAGKWFEEIGLPLLLLTSEENADELVYRCNGLECRRIAKPFSTDTLRSAVHRITA